MGGNSSDFNQYLCLCTDLIQYFENKQLQLIKSQQAPSKANPWTAGLRYVIFVAYNHENKNSHRAKAIT